ncbi:ribose-5-phosphate isomerase RpiA [Paenibacillus beijingensis]|uniref:Ribose-5-phosphate isomerase A n=1 Tax=Paenibacillus beijingensis TaxID=1126833 RepID=A0A0D5NH92_9BACL|nr:ribose-5-phosphate isomerase RpiA [Paenibacillus beijingensis]AJY74621.1 ribose 5-phosphate isomerase [Paenibacillus beijingensis]
MDLKKLAGEQAANMVESGMKVGLGTGSTAYWAVMRLGERMREGLDIVGVPTSEATKQLAIKLGIPLAELSTLEPLDLTIDGADEINPDLNLIKGGGGALFREKMVAAASRKLIVVADESKVVERLGAFTVPVEVVPYGWESTAKRVAAAGCVPKLRLVKAAAGNADTGAGAPGAESAFVTDNGNYILDCDFGLIEDPERLEAQINAILGVVETGLFIGMAELAVIAAQSGVRTLTR